MTQTAIDVCRKQSESRKRAGAYGGELEGHGRSDMGLGPMAGSWRVMEEATWGWGLWGGSWRVMEEATWGWGL